MVKVAHISDLHFNRIFPEAERALQEELNKENYRLIILSGDLTQRAYAYQFKRVKRFILGLKNPLLIIPGNHDIPNINIVRRIFSPFKYYKKTISQALDKVYQDDDLLVIGLNTAKRYPIRNGNISERQIKWAEKKFREGGDRFKMLVTHHPFIRPPHGAYRHIVKGAGAAVKAIKDCGVSVFLSGHFHTAYFGNIKNHFPDIKRDIVTSQAGTAISRRTRTDGNTFNTIHIEGNTFSVTSKGFLQNCFRNIETVTYRFNDSKMDLLAAGKSSG